jgi:hypothetical protein
MDSRSAVVLIDATLAGAGLVALFCVVHAEALPTSSTERTRARTVAFGVPNQIRFWSKVSVKEVLVVDTTTDLTPSVNSNS